MQPLALDVAHLGLDLRPVSYFSDIVGSEDPNGERVLQVVSVS